MKASFNFKTRYRIGTVEQMRKRDHVDFSALDIVNGN